MYEYESENTFEFNPEMTSFEDEQFEFGQSEWGEVFNESEVMELTAELLEITNEAELDRFFNGVIGSVGRALGKTVKSRIGQAVGGLLKGVAKKALPLAGGALGAYCGGPLGARISSGLASAAGNTLGLELEALSQEDREFEGGKQFVRFAADTVKSAISAPPNIDPKTVAQSAAATAAQKYAPNLLGPGSGPAAPSSMPGKGGGKWFRRGRNIIIVNC